MWFAEPECFRAHELAALVGKATGADLHVVLAPQAVWRSDQAQAAANSRLAALYADFGAAPGDREEPGLGDVAALLSRPPEARYGWISDRTARLGILVAGSSWFGLVAIREGEDIWLRTFHKEWLSGVLAGVLPDNYGQATGQPLSVLRSELLSADRTGIAPNAQVRQAQRLAALDPYVNAELHAEFRDRDGHRRRSPFPLRVYDTEAGRWALRTRAHYRDEHWEFIPATTTRVAELLDTLSSDIPG